MIGPRQVCKGIVELREQPDEKANRGKLESQLLMGELFTVYEERQGWYWGHNNADQYVGYVQKDALSETLFAPSHIVDAVRTHVYQEATLRSPIVDTYSMLSAVAVAEEHGSGFSRLLTGGWVATRHLVTFDKFEDDYVATALRFVETPYAWGGRSGMGIDCSGLVQIALLRAGIPCPRDTEQQCETIGKAVDGKSLKRGDIVFFPGHVGIMADDENIVHANAHHMRTVVEPLADVLARGDINITVVRRP